MVAKDQAWSIKWQIKPIEEVEGENDFFCICRKWLGGLKPLSML